MVEAGVGGGGGGGAVAAVVEVRAVVAVEAAGWRRWRPSASPKHSDRGHLPMPERTRRGAPPGRFARRGSPENGLDRDGLGVLAARCEVVGPRARVAKGGVEAAVVQIAREREQVPRCVGLPTGHESAVSLSDEIDQVGVRTDLRGDDAAIPEARVEVAVVEVALDPKRVQIRRLEHGASDCDLSVGCDRERSADLVVWFLGHDDAVVAEARMELSVREITDDREVSVRILVVGGSGDDALPPGPRVTPAAVSRNAGSPTSISATPPEPNEPSRPPSAWRRIEVKVP